MTLQVQETWFTRALQQRALRPTFRRLRESNSCLLWALLQQRERCACFPWRRPYPRWVHLLQFRLMQSNSCLLWALSRQRERGVPVSHDRVLIRGGGEYMYVYVGSCSWAHVCRERGFHRGRGMPVCCNNVLAYPWWDTTAIPIIIEGHETAFNGCEYQFTTWKPLKNLKPTLNYHGNGSIIIFVLLCKHM